MTVKFSELKIGEKFRFTGDSTWLGSLYPLSFRSVVMVKTSRRDFQSLDGRCNGGVGNRDQAEVKRESA